MDQLNGFKYMNARAKQLAEVALGIAFSNARVIVKMKHVGLNIHLAWKCVGECRV